MLPLPPPLCVALPESWHFLLSRVMRGLILAILLASSLLRLEAGGGPSAWLVVYDPGSPHSVAIARYYQVERDFPESHLMAYDFPKLGDAITVDQRMTSGEVWDFVVAIRGHLAAHGLEGQIDGITLAGMTPTMYDQAPGNGFGSLTAALWHAPNAGTSLDLESLVLGADNAAFRGPSGGSSGVLHPTQAN